MFDRFRSLSVRQQVLLVGLIAAASCALFAGIWFFALRTPYAPLFTGLRTTDAATIIAELDRQKIPYTLSDGGSAILVPSDIVDRTRLNVMTDDLPLKGTVGFELFNKTDLGLTDFAQKINYQRALQGELERTIMTLDGVEAARVHLSLGEDRVFRDDRVPPKASVTIRMQRGRALSAAAAEGIQRLIAAAVPNLESANVVILDAEGRIVAQPTKPAVPIDASTPFAQEKRAIEQYYAARIRAAVGSADPQDTISVAVLANVAAALDGHTDAAQMLAAWTPASRAFPLQVTVSRAAGTSTVPDDSLRNVVAGAVGMDSAKNDVILFGADTEESPEIATQNDATRIEKPRFSGFKPVLPETDDGWSWIAIVSAAMVVLLFIALAVLAVRLIRRNRALSDAQREQFADRLRRALEGEAEHAAS